MQIDTSMITSLTRAPESDKTTKTRAAAKDFEALLISQMLRSARESGSSGWIGSGDDQSSSPAIEFAEQQIAALMANAGGLGLADSVVQGLNKPQTTPKK